MKKKTSKITMRRSKIHGRGVFARVRIRKGEPICEYKGRLITHDEADDRYGGEDTGHTFLFTLNDQWVVDGNRGGNLARWINHACEPNCEAGPEGPKGRERVVVRALRSIRPGEELTYDYVIEVDHRISKKERELWACRCGTPKCTGTLLNYVPKK